MIRLALALGLLSVTVPSDPGMVMPVSIVDDPVELRSGLKANGVRFDGLFTVTVEDGERARHALRPYLESAIARERDPSRKTAMQGILEHIAFYDWHCGGFIRHGHRSLFCVFDRGLATRMPGKFFPAIADGGIRVCRCLFGLRKRRIEHLEWNGEA
jgi:hypothetical protein